MNDILLHGPLNSGNTCFMDAVIYSMFGYRHSPFVSKLLNSKEPVCKKIISCLEKVPCRFQIPLPDRISRGQQDPHEFYDYICKILNYEPMKITSIRQVIRNSDSTLFKKTPIQESLSCFIIDNISEDICFKDIIDPKWENLEEDNWIKNSRNQKTYSKTRNLVFFTRVDCYVFYYNRCVLNGKTPYKIDMPLYINTKNKDFFLFSCILHLGSSSRGGHYISIIFDSESSFYVYDDMNGDSIKNCKFDYERNKEFVQKNAVMFFYYSKIKPSFS